MIQANGAVPSRIHRFERLLKSKHFGKVLWRQAQKLLS